jgi:hypothetical protein
MSPLRAAYCNLVRAVWADPAVREQIIADPRLLSSYGFDTVPSRVKFTIADGRSGIISYEADDGGAAVTIYMPSVPPDQHQDDGESCCCPICIPPARLH